MSEIAKIAWSTTTTAIDRLVRQNMVSNVQNDGEKNILRVSKDYAYFLGVSIGTSHIKVCVLDFSFGFAEKELILGCLDKGSRYMSDFWDHNNFFQLPGVNEAIWCANTPANGLLNVKQLINDLCAFAIELSQKVTVLAIGFSFPGHIDNKKNIIIKSSNLDFNLINVGMNTLFTNEMLQRLEEKDITICFEHNAKAAAIAEKSVGCLKDQVGNSLVLYLGTGLGVAFWLDGKLYRGGSNAAGSQYGHMKIDYSDGTDSLEQCSCGESGCLEQAIRSIFNRESKDFVKNSTGRELAFWLKEHEEAKKQFVEYLSRAVFNISSLLEIDVIVFSGKLGDMYDSFENLFQEKMIQFNQANIRIQTSKMGEYSAATGAAICGYYNLTGESIE